MLENTISELELPRFRFSTAFNLDVSGGFRLAKNRLNDLMILIRRHRSLTKHLNPLLTLQPIRTNQPNNIRHKRSLILSHNLRIIMPIKFRSTQGMQRVEVVIQDLHFVRSSVLDAEERCHVVDNVVEAGSEVES